MTIDIEELREKITIKGLDVVADTDILAVLDRLEAAESVRHDDYQNWMAALDRNAELLAKLEAAEKEADALRNESNARRTMADLLRSETGAKGE